MNAFIKKWNNKLGIAPASGAVILIILTYALVAWDMPEVDFAEFWRMPVVELEVSQLLLLLIAAGILTRISIRRRPQNPKTPQEVDEPPNSPGAKDG